MSDEDRTVADIEEAVKSALLDDIEFSHEERPEHITDYLVVARGLGHEGAMGTWLLRSTGTNELTAFAMGAFAADRTQTDFLG